MDRRLTDGHGRVVEYLRVSVTDRCDLRCSYCMPPSGIELAPRCEILRYKDLLALIEIFARLGVRKVRLTGGEPLIRRGITDFIRQVKDIPGIERIAVTTNGTNLVRMAAPLREAGVSQINVSLDTLGRDRFASITGRDGFDGVMKGIHAALDCGMDAVKINTVVIRGVNDGEVETFAELTRAMKVQARFIEFMPATRGVWEPWRFVPMDEVMERVSRLGRLIPCGRKQWGGPAKVYRLEGAAGEIGFISAVSRHFCGECNRARLTSTGGLMTCLFGGEDVNLKAMLDRGASKDEIEYAIISALGAKNAVRRMPVDGVDRHESSMSRVGG